jgi:hypothetical protein
MSGSRAIAVLKWPLAIGIILALVAVLLVVLPPDVRWAALVGGALVAAVAGIIWLAVAIHEAGHFIAALAMGMHVTALSVAPVQIRRAGSGWRLSFTGWTGQPDGMVHALPRTIRGLRWRWAIHVSAGPLASLTAAAVCGAVIMALHVAWTNTSGSSGGDLHFVVPMAACGVLGVLSFTSFLNLIPGALLPGVFRGSRTDGSQLIDLIRGGARTLGQVVSEMLASATRAGLRPRDWDAEWVRLLGAWQHDAPDRAGAALLQYYGARDTGRLEEAGKFLDLAADQAARRDKLPWFGVWVEVGYFAARYRGDVVLAQQALARVPKSSVEPHTYLRAESAVLLAEGQFAEAIEKAEKGLSLVRQSCDLGGAAAERDWLLDLLHAARSANGAAD